MQNEQLKSSKESSNKIAALESKLDNFRSDELTRNENITENNRKTGEIICEHICHKSNQSDGRSVNYQGKPRLDCSDDLLLQDLCASAIRTSNKDSHSNVPNSYNQNNKLSDANHHKKI